MTILIIEDEVLSSEKLVNILKEIDSGIQISNCLESITESVDWINSHGDIDLILSDIELSDGLCFEIFESCDIKCPVVFITSYDKYALKAFKTNCLDYVLKPFQKSDIVNCLLKVYKEQGNFEAPKHNENIKTIHRTLNQSYKSRFIIKMGDVYMFTPTDNISYFHIDYAGTYLYTWSSKKHFVDYNMDQLESVLNPDTFFRVNRSFIASINSIQRVIRYSNRRLKVEIKDFNNEDIIISREKALRFKNWLDI